MTLNSYTHNVGELPEISITLNDNDMDAFSRLSRNYDVFNERYINFNERYVNFSGTAVNIIPVDSTRPDGENRVVPYFPKVKKVYFNKTNNTTCVIWSDGIKTILSLCEGDNWDEEKVLALAYMKRACGNNGSFKKVFEKFNIY